MSTTETINRFHPIYDRPIAVEVLSTAQTAINTTNNQQVLKFRILNGQRASAVTNQSEKLIHIEVSDDTNHCFLYVLTLGEHDYSNFKKDQSLFVEFSSFPAMLIELINKSQRKELSQDQSSQSIFNAKLDISTGLFTITESNTFKQLVYISLHLRPGNDNAIKAYLAARLDLMIGMVKDQSNQISALESDRDDRNKVMEQYRLELQELRVNRQVEIESQHSQHTMELSKYRELTAKELNELRIQHDHQLQEIRRVSEEKKDELESKIASLEQSMAELSSVKNKVDYNNRDLSQQLTMVTEHRDRLQSELQSLMGQIKVSDEKTLQLDRQAIALQAKVEGLMTQLLEKEQIVKKSAELHNQSEDGRHSLREQAITLTHTIAELQEQIKQQSLDLKQSREERAGLLLEVQELDTIRQRKTEVIRRQEEEVKQLREAIVGLERQLVATNHEYSQAKETINQLDQRLKEAQSTIAEQTSRLENNQILITHLNEMQNQVQLGIVSSSTTATPMAAKTPIRSAMRNTPLSANYRGNIMADSSPPPSSYPVPGSQYQYDDSHRTPFLSQSTRPSYEPPSVSSSNAVFDKKLQEFSFNAGIERVTPPPPPPQTTSLSHSSANRFTAAGVNSRQEELPPRPMNTGYHLESTAERKKSSPSASSVTAKGTDLSQLDYYASVENIYSSPPPRTALYPATVTPTTATATRLGTAVNSGNSGGRYNWQSDEWINSTLAKNGL